MGTKGADGIVGIEFAMARLAIEAVKFEVFIELRKTDEALEGGLAHLGDVFELHVIGDESLDLVGVVVGKTKTSAEGIRHADADLDVAIETDTVPGFRGGTEGGRLADVMKKDAPGECGRNSSRKVFEHEKGVDPDVTLGMKLRRLRNTLQGGDFRENFGEEAPFVQKLEGAPGRPFREQLRKFFANALGGHDQNFAGVLADGGKGYGFDCVTEARGKADGAEHAEFVFGKTAGRLADGADDFGGEIGAAADEVEDFVGVVAHEEAVDGEIAALDVFGGAPGVADFVGVAAVGVAEVGAKCGDLDFEGIIADEDYAELRADVEAVGEELQDFLRRCIC